MNMLTLFGSGAGIGKFLQSVQESLGNWGQIIVSIIGVAMVIVGLYKIAKNLISHGKGQNSWVVAIALVLVGGAMAVTGGWGMIGGLVNTGKTSMENFANGQGDTTNSIKDPFTHQ